MGSKTKKFQNMMALRLTPTGLDALLYIHNAAPYNDNKIGIKKIQIEESKQGKGGGKKERLKERKKPRRKKNRNGNAKLDTDSVAIWNVQISAPNVFFF